MRPANPGKKCYVLLLPFLLFACFGIARAQQAATEVPAAGQSATSGGEEGGAVTPAQNRSAAASSANGDVAKPAMPGGQTVLVKDENDIPKRKNMEYEDWSSPELTPGMKTEAVPLLKAELNGFSRELVSVQWRELDPIDLWIIKPAGVKNPPVVLYLYSSPADNARYKDTQFCQFVTRNGVAAVGFVAAVTGQRLHDRPTKDTFINQLQEALGSTSHDVQMILTYLAKRGDLDMNRVGMWGDGAGASVAIMAAAVDPRIKALDLLDPWGDWPDWLANSSLVRDSERATLLKPEMLKMVEKLDPIKYLPQLKTPLVRLQYIEEGLTATPALVQQKMEAAAPSQVNIVRYQSMKAFLDDVASKGTGFDWIKERVGSVVAGQANESHDAEKAAANLSGSSK